MGVRNGETLPFMRPDDVIEVACVVGAEGAVPVPINDFSNEHIMEMMQMLKAYERHTVKAAVNGDDEEALRALMINPLLGDFRAAKDCYEELKQAHAAYLPQFFRK